jgi:hypothetical protein
MSDYYKEASSCKVPRGGAHDQNFRLRLSYPATGVERQLNIIENAMLTKCARASLP